jgi:uncharacterized membrane protein
VRVLKHLLTPQWLALRAFPSRTLREIETAIKASERQHDGELRFAVEASLPFAFLNLNARKRAEALFAQLGVWDTEHNSGVLIYVQLVSRHIDIVADRGIARRVEQAKWDAVCRAMEQAFGKKRFLEGSLQALEEITRILARHFPASGRNPNELPDKPLLL